MSTQEIPLQPDFRQRAKANDVAVARLIGFEAKDVADGRATVVLAAGPQHADPMGTLHGGLHCDIADAAMGMAFASTLAPEESFTTVELKINFFRPVWTAQLRAEGTVVQRGRTIGYVECTVSDEENRLVAKAQPPPAWCFAARRPQDGKRCVRRRHGLMTVAIFWLENMRPTGLSWHPSSQEVERDGSVLPQSGLLGRFCSTRPAPSHGGFCAKRASRS